LPSRCTPALMAIMMIDVLACVQIDKDLLAGLWDRP
jgi:hypothetical protein